MLYLLKRKKNTICALLFGFLFSGVNLVEQYFESGVEMNVSQWLLFAAKIIFFTVVAGELYLRLEAFLEKKTERKEFAEKTRPKVSDRAYFLVCVLVLCIAYLPVFMAYYPGIFAYDVDTQIPQFMEGYSKHHNLIHTLYLHFFYYFVGGKLLHSYTAGIAFASIVQMTLFSMMVSYIHVFLRRIGIGLKTRIVLVGLTALLPFFSVLSVSMTKDVFFAGFAGMLSVCFYDWENNTACYGSLGKRVFYVFSIIGTILFRNNGIYAVVISACAGIVFIVLLKKNLVYLRCTVIGIVMALLISSGMAAAVSAVNGSQNEMLSIPYQQMACVYHTEYDHLTGEEKEKILELIPDVEKYNPHLSDPIKANATGAYQKKELLKCYLQLFIKYPFKYAEAFLTHNAGYFYIGDTSHATIYGADLEERSGYLLTDTKPGFGVEHKSYFKILEDFYERLFSANEYENYFFLRILCSPATYFWLVLLLCFYAIDLKRFCPVQFGFIFGLILTVLAGPCSLIRYAFPYILCVPALAAAVISEKDANEQKVSGDKKVILGRNV